MKSTFKLLGIIALLAVIGFSFASCGDEGGEPAGPAEPPETAMYSGIAEDGSVYTLKVIENTGRYTAQDGDSYIMYQVKDGETKTSSGTVTTVGTTLTLKPTSITITFTITINDTGITSITGTITFDDKTEVKAPETIAPLPNVPENWPVAERWDGWAVDLKGNTATLNYTVDKDGVCAITVGGKAVPPLNETGGTDGDVKYYHSIYFTAAAYRYTIIAGKSYTYTFEAWTDGPERALNIHWYEWPNDLGFPHETGWESPEDGDSTQPPVFKITSVRKTYTITTEGPLPKSYIWNLGFNCANQTGTFYVKIISIESFDAPVTPATLASYLSTLPANTPNNPYTIPITISTDGNNEYDVVYNQFSVIKAVLYEAPNKYVFLDFSRNNIKDIPEFAFSTQVNEDLITGVNTLIGVTIPSTVTRIHGHAFHGCVNLANVNIPNSITSISWCAFQETSITSITIPDSVTEMSGWEFHRCVKLANIIIGKGLTRIEDGTFASCNNYSSITIPANIKSIGWFAFVGLNLTSVTFQGTILASDFDPEAFLHQDSDLREKYLAGGIGTYTRANGQDETATWTKQ
jgi:hypothetical protein